jgi:hypothetical protein
MKDKAYREIELRSEEVQEVMGKIPPLILRWGITVLFFVVTALLLTSSFFLLHHIVHIDNQYNN